MIAYVNNHIGLIVDDGIPDPVQVIEPYTWPRPTSLWKPPNPEAVAEHTTKTHKKRPLTSPARGLLGLLMSQFDRDAQIPKTYGEAYEALTKYGTGLFGTRD